MQKAGNLLAETQLDPALAEVQTAIALAPDSVDAQLMLGDVLAATGQIDQARAAYEKALMLAKTIEPEVQVRSIPNIEQKLASIATTP